MPASTPFQLAAHARKKLAADNREKLRAFAREKLAAARHYQPKRVTARMVALATEAIFDIPFAEIAGKGRAQTVVAPRFAIALFARDRLGRSFPEIGRFLGGRDHSTITHAYSEAKRRLADDPDFAAACAEIETLLWGSDAKEPLSRVAGEGQG